MTNEQILEDAISAGFDEVSEDGVYVGYYGNFHNITLELTKFAEITKARAIEACNRQNSEPIYQIKMQNEAGLSEWTDVNSDTYSIPMDAKLKRIVYLAPPQPQTVRDALEKAVKICDEYTNIEVDNDFNCGVRNAAVKILSEIRALINQPQPPASQEFLETLESIVKAWDSLPAGLYSPTDVQTWLAEDMKPVIDDARQALQSKPAKELL